jgi:hypothetical protein
MSDDIAFMSATKLGALGGAPGAAPAEAPERSSRSMQTAHAVGRRPAQNWVLDPVQDTVLIIAAPLLVLAIALLAFRMLPATSATSLIIVSHVVLTVAHHLPTFIRIYGDVELFRRYRWSFVLAPVIPLAFSAGVLAYINYRGLPIEYFLYLYIMLALWDPWHFLRQHYGFMRIYDRGNEAPKSLAARMDLTLCSVWFVYIMLASGAWLAGMFQDLYASANLPVIAALAPDAIARVTSVMRDIALLVTATYVIYLAWCWRRGYFVSRAKLALIVATFGVMYLMYAPNAWMQSLAPEWTFKVGFAALGIVHMTQYLAIVWRYNRRIGQLPGRARPGVFARLHARGGWVVAVFYVLVCLAYGEIITTVHDNRLLMSVLLAVGFTSTLMHYYFDGFIWKLRHRQNREGLALTTEREPSDAATDGIGPAQAEKPSIAGRLGGAANLSATTEGAASDRGLSPRQVLTRQFLYFGVPMLVLSIGAISQWGEISRGYIHDMYAAYQASQRGDAEQVLRNAQVAFTAMERDLPISQRLAALDPTAAREADLAFLVYNHSYYANVVLPALTGQAERRERHRLEVSEAIERLEHAIQMGGPIGHPGRENLTRDDARRTLASWQRLIA